MLYNFISSFFLPNSEFENSWKTTITIFDIKTIILIKELVHYGNLNLKET